MIARSRGERTSDSPGLRPASAGPRDPQPESSSRRGSRAFWLGSRRDIRLALLALAAVGAGVGGGLLVAGHDRARTSASSAKYGTLPSWLPKAKISVGRIADASTKHPWLAIEGDTVSVHLSDGRTMAQVVGPNVPEEGEFPVPATTPCTFTITFTAASGVVPLRARAFTILDELGHIHHPRVSVTGGGALPRRVAPGQTVSLTVSDVLPTGNGRLRWTPTGAKPTVSWDFDVEID